MSIERTQVGIVGAGPAGLFLAHLLKAEGIESVILESRSREYIEGRVRAGVLESGTVRTMQGLGLDQRLNQEGVVDEGLDIRFQGRKIHMDLVGLTGRSVMIYGQQEVVKDLVKARLDASDPLLFEAKVERLSGLEGERPTIHYTQGGEEHELACDLIAGCDGFHGISREAVPQGTITAYTQEYDFAWLGVLARARPIADMTYSNSDRGFALCSRRSMSVSRLYLQVPNDDSPDNWSDERFWEELRARMFDVDGLEIEEGEIFQRDMAHLRAFVATPLQYGSLYLAGDAVHIVPPAGAKGLNMAVADVKVLSHGMISFFKTGSRDMLNHYTKESMTRIWKTLRFSTALTGLLHKLPEHTAMQRHLQLSELDYIAGSIAAQTSIAEQYVALSDIPD